MFAARRFSSRSTSAAEAGRGVFLRESQRSTSTLFSWRISRPGLKPEMNLDQDRLKLWQYSASFCSNEKRSRSRGSQTLRYGSETQQEWNRQIETDGKENVLGCMLERICIFSFQKELEQIYVLVRSCILPAPPSVRRTSPRDVSRPRHTICACRKKFQNPKYLMAT